MRRPPSTRRSRRTGLLATALLVALGGCRQAPPAPAAVPARPVVLAEVTSGALTEHLRVVGVLAPRDEVRLSFKVPGIVEAIAVEEGVAVRRGALLAQLKATEVDAQLVQAREAADKAERDLARGRALYADEVATREQVEDLSTAAASTRAGLEAARFNARYARIEAPGDGVVLRKLAEPGEHVQAGQPVLSVADLGRGWVVRAGFADRDVVKIRRGAQARVTLDAFPERSFSAVVQQVGSSADPQNGTFQVEFAVRPDGAPFAAGMVAKIDVDHLAVDDTHPVVPLTALLAANGDRATVYVVAAGSDVARRRTIRIGAVDGLRVAALEGLSVGERVVTDGAAYLADGERVRATAGAGVP